MISIPTISELYDGIIDNIEAEYGSNIPLFGKNFLRCIAAVQAAKLKLYYLAIGHLQKNIFIDTADPESMGGTLERFGRIKLGREPFGAVAGSYNVTVTGTIGATLPASSTFKSDDDSLNPGKLFILDEAHIMVTVSDSIVVRALEAGTGSKLMIGDTLSLTAPIANVNRAATVTTESVEPLAAETVEEYRTKALAAYRLEPNGGSASDYRLWASDAQGVQRVYPYARSGFANELNIYVEATIDDSTDGLGTPSAALLESVEDVIELDPDTSKPINERGRKPLGIFNIEYLPVTIKEVDIEITGFVGLTAAIQTSIFNAIKAEIDNIRPYIAAADTPESKNDILDVNKIISIILLTRPGSTFGAVDLSIATVSLSTFTFTNGDIPHLNSVTYV